MLFNSYGFIFLYLPVVLLGFFWLARLSHAFAAGWLALASLFFYGYWNPAYIGLLSGSIIGNYAFGMWIAKAGVSHKDRRKKGLLIAAIASNLALLAYYKYANFFVASVNAAAGTQWSLGEIMLPLGISFFTFTQIAFLVDTYQGKVKEYNFVHYLLFVTYFPHLIAGPILHHKEMMPQFAHASTYRVNWEHVATGLLLFTLGLCKKVLWADSLAPFATAIFDGARHAMTTGTLPTIYEAWSGALAYTLQIYFDFSGYTDMALGVALMFGIRLPINFNSPYKATSIIEFWRRWHMTLSRFLRDYLYIPLGGNRKGKLRRYLNLMTTMLLGGLWHGAGWTFVVWGALHGAYLAINHLWREITGERLARIPNWLGALAGGALTFIAVVAAWVVFRADSMAHALFILKAMFGIASRPISFDAVIHGNLLLLTDVSGRDLMRLLVPGLLWVWLLPNSSRIRFVKGSMLLALLQAAIVFGMLYLAVDQFGSYSPFLYFQF
ncbi:MBOAT family O-acyltransferase [Candidatus Ferrigenium straubiae]|jgi:D-alanyl-lipoteichoic acid acyltransferase DltB (MBOAT superfamily)|uniref:MBOAT family O-acyltransferase n=1 Tax=Candidatus Ferrigenium straubiae TaxID=2919506 RepID=UPI003F4ADEC3